MKGQRLSSWCLYFIGEFFSYHISSFLGHFLKFKCFLSSSSPEEDNSIEATLATLVSHISVRLVRMPMLASFSRGQALSLAASLLSPRSLLFFADVDVLISAASLHRIRLNTLLGKQAYFPVVFSEFSPQTVHRHSSSWNPPKRQEDNNHFVYNQRRGYFRHFGYGIVSIFRTDFDAIGHFNLTIKGWGMEDVDLFERVVKFRMLRPFRAPDPGKYFIKFEKFKEFLFRSGSCFPSHRLCQRQ